MKKKSIILISAIVVVIASIAIMGTLAYFTAEKTVTNTFTVGNVEINLEENAWIDSAKLVPGIDIPKDPTVTVLEGSEESYVRMLVTINNIAAFDNIFAPTGANLVSIFQGYDDTLWVFEKEVKVGDTITYEFRYVDTVDALSADEELKPLFTGILVPSFITGEQLATLDKFEIKIKAQAIQAAGFSDTTDNSDPSNPVTTLAVDNAWAAFVAPVTP